MISELITELDTGLYSHVESQTSLQDRRSLLAVHSAVARLGPFSYLEIGSHLGGTLQPMVADPRCRKIVSIDPRPKVQPDDRADLPVNEYPDNSTERMLTLLAGVPDADLSKLVTVEDSTENLSPAAFERPDLSFIDGEHTYQAALRDARFCRALMRDEGIIMFHDRAVIGPAIVSFMAETPSARRGYSLASGVFAVELGDRSVLTSRAVRGQIHGPAAPWLLANRLSLGRWLFAAEIVARRSAKAALAWAGRRRRP